MGNKSSSSSSQLPPYLFGSEMNSKNLSKHRSSPYKTAPYSAQCSAAEAFYQSATSLHHMNISNSGYLINPTDFERWRLHNWNVGRSRLSLNDTLVIDGGAVASTPTQPPLMAVSPLTIKQFKKWQKKQKKLLKKMGPRSPNIIAPHALITPYVHALSVDSLPSKTLDSYADVPSVVKRNWKGFSKVQKKHAFDDATIGVAPNLSRSTVSSCSNRCDVSNLHVVNSTPSTNASDQSCLTSTVESSSPSKHQKPPSIQFKNSSEQYLQRVELSRNSSESVGLLDQLQRGKQSEKEDCSPNTRHCNAGIINGEINSDVRKCRMDDSLVGNNYVSKSTSMTSIQIPSATTSYEFIKHGLHEVRNSANVIMNKSSLHNVCDEVGSDGISRKERTIPVTKNLEVKGIQDSELLRTTDANLNHDEKTFSSDETSTNCFRQCTLASGTTIQMPSSPHNTMECLSLQRSADCGSTISSLTQSSNMKTEFSDIDFSWVNDVENRLEREIAFVREDSRQNQQQHLPIRYFGMDMDHRAVKLPLHTTAKRLEVFGECESRKELSHIHSNVRSKAAMFDTEAFRNKRKFDEQVICRNRSQSTHRGNLYIPQPDYQIYNPISVDTSQNSNQYCGIHLGVPVTTAIKWERCSQCRGEDSDSKINGCIESGLTHSTLDSHKNGDNDVMMKQEQQHCCDHRTEILERNRNYGKAEYHIQNIVRRGVEESLQTPVAC